MHRFGLSSATFFAAALFATSALAQTPGPCRRGVAFPQFLAQLKQDAAAAGVSPRAIAEASPYLVYDQGIVNRDRGQRVFGQVFTEFSGRMAAPYRMQQGQAHIKTYAAAFARFVVGPQAHPR